MMVPRCKPLRAVKRARPRAMLLTALAAAWPLAGMTQQDVPLATASPPAATAVAKTTSSLQQGFDEKLVRALQRHNAISHEDAEALLKDLREQQAQEASSAPAAPAAHDAGAAPASAAAAAAAEAAQTKDQDGDVHVHYIPESERLKLSDEVTQRILAADRERNYVKPAELPDWLSRISFYGDLRYRQQYDFYNGGNAPVVNFQVINSGTPFDVSANNTNLPPLFNTTQNREEPRFRLRLGADGRINDQLAASFRFDSGNTTNPVSSNQTLGGDFNKTTFVIARAFFDYHPNDHLEAWLGRIPKPWLSTNAVWYDDLGFDGVAARYRRPVGAGFTPFITAGAFSIENTALDFPSNSLGKAPSRDKWLYAAQIGTEWRLNDAVDSTTGLAFYDFNHIQGKTSSPCLVLNTTTNCDSDNSRPGFIQRGNTLFQLRNLIPDPSNPAGPQFQYFGLASPFRVLDVVSSWDFAANQRIHVILTLDYATNLAYDNKAIQAKTPVNNIGSDNLFHGGNNAYQAQLLVGTPEIQEQSQWSLLGGYKRIESDAVVDAFDDPDFFSINGIGGTNDKGYFVIASLGLLHHTWLSARWFSGQQVSGPPVSVDTLQLDLNGRF